MSEENLPDWAKKKQNEVLPDWASVPAPESDSATFEGSLAKRLEESYKEKYQQDGSTLNRLYSDYNRFAEATPLVPTTTELRKYGQRLGMEIAPAVGVGGETHRRTRPLGPTVAMGSAALATGVSALAGNYADRFALGNKLPGDTDPLADLITFGGGSLGLRVPRFPSEAASEASSKGIRLSAGAASSSPTVKWTASKIAELPFVGGNMQRAIQQSLDDFQSAVDNISGRTSLAPGSSTGAFVQSTRDQILKQRQQQADDLYDLLNDAVDPTVGVEVTALREFLEGETRKGVASAFVDQTAKLALKLIRESDQGIPSGQLSWQNLDDIRRRAGRLMNSVTADADKGLMKKIYGLASKEQNRIVSQLSEPERLAWERANDFSKQFINWKEQTKEIAKTQKIDQIWKSITVSPNLTNIEKVAKAVGGKDTEAWQQIRSAVLRDMGTDVKSKSFNLNTWLNNYAKVAKDSSAANALWGDLQKDMDSLALIARSIASGGQGVNTSRTATTQIFYALLGAAGGALYNKSPELAMKVGAGLGGAKLLDFLMTQPWAIKMLAKGAQVPGNSFRKKSVWAKQFIAAAVAEGYKSEAEAVTDILLNQDVPTIPTQ